MPRKAPKPLTEITEGPIQFDVLSWVKFRQLENGLKSKDYQRYRKFCARKLQRVRKAAKSLQKQEHSHDVMNDVEEALLLVERAWAMAQELEFQLEEEDEEIAEVLQRRRNIHATKRLRKSGNHAENFLNLMQEKAEPITAIDAEAYYFWIKGESARSCHDTFEAMTNYGRAKAIFKLLQRLDLRPVSFLADRLEACQVRMQICEQEMSPQEVTKANKSIVQFSEKIQDQESALTAAKSAQNQTSDFMSIDDWMGEQILLTEPHAMRCFKQVQTLTEKLQNCEDPQKKASSHLKLMNHFYLIQNDPKLNKDLNVLEYSKFYYYIHNLNRYWQILTKVCSTKMYAPAVLEEKWKDYKILLEELAEVRDWSRFKFNDEIQMHELFADIMRSYIVGQSHIEAGNNLEAYSIGSYAEVEAQGLLGHSQDVSFSYLPHLKSELKQLCDDCSRQRIAGQTGYILAKEDERENVISGMKNLGITDAPVFLTERKNDFNFGKQQNPALVQFPLKLEALLPKPCYLDCARLHTDFPDCEERLQSTQQENQGGWFGGLWG